jgi:ribosomal peptide maturation radical SAM protein 1
MYKRTHALSTKIALVSAPWPLYTRPSIQLGTLKAFLGAQFCDIQIDCHHFYLKLAETIGYRIYHEISQHIWPAEAIYAAALFPDRFRQIEMLFQNETRTIPHLRKTALKSLARRVKEATDAYINHTKWQTYALVGFSVSLCQLTSTLYLIKAIKSKHPGLLTVIGGSSFSSNSARSLLNLFPEIDMVVVGEGELPLAHVIGGLKQTGSIADRSKIQGVITGYDTKEDDFKNGFFQMDTLKRLPPPDYDDYFNLLETLPEDKSFFPTLPLEISRGCWWLGRASSGNESACAFCNLNLQWKGYRSKDPLQAVAEIDDLTTKYKTLTLAFTDNVLPKGKSAQIFNKLGKLNKDLCIFSEIRATTPLSDLKAMRDAGMQEIQIGIEALSTRLLKKLKKGTTAIQNLEIMRNCEALGLVDISNLILHFPGSDKQDVAQTLLTLEFALPYRPLKTVGFWLGLESPVWRDPGSYGIKKLFNHRNWSHLFPQAFYQRIAFAIQDYRGDKTFQKKLWQPVKRQVKRWHKMYTDLNRNGSGTPILSFRDGRNFLIIRQKRFGAEPLTHRLEGSSRAIYLFCQRHRSIRTIRRRFPTFSEDKLVAFLKMMVAKRLMFSEKDKYLSLAVHIQTRIRG